MVNVECSIGGCERSAVLRGWCRFHYQRWRRYGDPERERPTVADRLTERTERTEGCWIWRGALDRDGYGLIRVEGVLRRAARVAWELAHGPIPAGLSILHACDNPPCIRPDHLMLGTQLANVRDAIAKGRRSRKTA